FDRSWYNRAIVEPVLGFCTPEQHERFMAQVPAFESLLTSDGIRLIKLWFSIGKETQRQRLEARRTDVRRQWKLSPVDGLAQERWDLVTRYKEKMYAQTHTSDAPWVIVQGQDKFRARTETMRYVLQTMSAEPVTEAWMKPDPAIVRLYGE
ncbi:MAG: polyphosphate kinase 2, partial [Myxococcota bacterium]